MSARKTIEAIRGKKPLNFLGILKNYKLLSLLDYAYRFTACIRIKDGNFLLIFDLCNCFHFDVNAKKPQESCKDDIIVTRPSGKFSHLQKWLTEPVWFNRQRTRFRTTGRWFYPWISQYSFRG